MLTIPQLATLLQQFTGPARIQAENGMVVAQNEAARGEAPTDERDWNDVARIDLGDGMTLYRWGANKSAEASPDENLSTQAHQAQPLSTQPAQETGIAAANAAELANSMAHSIRNPLSAIVTASKLVAQEEGISEETKMLLDVILKESRQLDVMISDFLHYVRPQKVQIAPLDIRKIVAQTVSMMQRDGVLAPHIRVFNEVPDDALVSADEVQIGRALQSIVRNAAQMMPRDGSLTVTGDATNGDFELLVDDTGGGFSPEDLQRAFEPFYSRTPEGVGLGLPIARDAIVRCGGKIALKNVEGGARVVVCLPRA